MSDTGKTAFGGSALAAVVILGLIAPAQAQAPVAAHSLTPSAIPAAPATTPSTTPAIGGSAAQQGPVQPAKPAALNPTTAQIMPGPVACRAPLQLSHLDHPLLHTAQRLAGGEPLVVVAIGSSSTAGAGASSPVANYPSRLAVELKKLFPGHEITVLNRGVNGEETHDMMARFATGVIAEHPQLVLWQVGTNSVLRDHPLDTHAVELHKGIEQLKAIGADVVLIDPQYSPKVLAKSETPGMVDQIALAAKDENVDLFHRFAVMRDWHDVQHDSFDVFVSPDGLHMNDWGYACWAKLLAAAIADAANPPVASALRPTH
ncbi:MAG TPA: SGNH/GDSL hydrolase family protein [Xanthobacteraceae bacterium]|nr:SGNH/GDSL hydrolase family protein [Xanthobacteraceae bacterium]